MKRTALISCARKKLSFRSKASSLYISSLFKLNLQYAKKLNPDSIFILSAKYGLLNLEDEIDLYNKTLNDMKVREIKIWANSVIKKLVLVADLINDEFIFLAGNKYRKYLIPHILKYSIPLEGKRIGEQLQFLMESI